MGLVVDSRIKWEEHVNYVCKKISPYVFILRRLSKFFDKKTLFVIYSSYILSNIIYINPIWSRAPQIHLKKIEILVKKSIKIIHRYPILYPTSMVYSEKYLSFDNICKR